GYPTGQLVLINLTNNQPRPGDYRRFEPFSLLEPGEFPPGTDPSRFNFRAFTPAIPAMEKGMYFVTGRYKVFGDGLQLYGDVMYSKAKQDNGLAAAPFTYSSATNGDQAAIRNSPFNAVGIDPNTGANALLTL